MPNLATKIFSVLILLFFIAVFAWIATYQDIIFDVDSKNVSLSARYITWSFFTIVCGAWISSILDVIRREFRKRKIATCCGCICRVCANGHRSGIHEKFCVDRIEKIIAEFETSDWEEVREVEHDR